MLNQLRETHPGLVVLATHEHVDHIDDALGRKEHELLEV